MAKARKTIFSARIVDMNPQNGWDSAPDAENGIHWWKNRWQNGRQKATGRKNHVEPVQLSRIQTETEGTSSYEYRRAGPGSRRRNRTGFDDSGGAETRESANPHCFFRYAGRLQNRKRKYCISRVRSLLHRLNCARRESAVLMNICCCCVRQTWQTSGAPWNSRNRMS